MSIEFMTGYGEVDRVAVHFEEKPKRFWYYKDNEIWEMSNNIGEWR